MRNVFGILTFIFLSPLPITLFLIQKELKIEYTGGKALATVDSTYCIRAEAIQYGFYYTFNVDDKHFLIKDNYPSSTQDHHKGEKLLVAYNKADPSECYIVSTKNKRNKIIIVVVFSILSCVSFFYYRKSK